MAIGERIRFFRNKKGVTQKYLGQVVGFPERSADVRMAQYETGSRTPKADLTRTLAGFFEVSTDALTVPDIDSDIGLMHTLFALEDIRGLTIGEIDGEICLKLDKSKGKTYVDMLEMLSACQEAGGRGDHQRGLRPLALQLPQVRHHPEMGQSPLQGIERLPCGSVQGQAGKGLTDSKSPYRCCHR